MGATYIRRMRKSLVQVLARAINATDVASMEKCLCESIIPAARNFWKNNGRKSRHLSRGENTTL